MTVGEATARGPAYIRLNPGLTPEIDRAIRAYPGINGGRCACYRVFWHDNQWIRSTIAGNRFFVDPDRECSIVE